MERNFESELIDFDDCDDEGTNKPESDSSYHHKSEDKERTSSTKKKKSKFRS